MFLGEFQHSLDTKGRVILPAKYRDQLANGAFVTKGKGGCLSVFTPEEFETVATQIREQSDVTRVASGTWGRKRERCGLNSGGEGCRVPRNGVKW